MSMGWTEARWSLYAPLYDAMVANRLETGRRRAHELVSIGPGERVLMDGGGTGLDLEHIPRGARVTAIDVSPAMISRLEARAEKLDIEVDAHVMNGHKLDFPNGAFDVVLLHLILGVIPDAARCAREADRVLREGGRVSIFDKFLPDGKRPSLARRFANVAARMLATDLNRRLGDILAPTSLHLTTEEPSIFGGLFRVGVAVKR